MRGPRLTHARPTLHPRSAHPPPTLLTPSSRLALRPFNAQLINLPRTNPLRTKKAKDKVDAAERKRDKKRRKKKAPEQDVEYAYKAPQPDYLASLKKAVVAGEGRWFE